MEKHSILNTMFLFTFVSDHYYIKDQAKFETLNDEQIYSLDIGCRVTFAIPMDNFLESLANSKLQNSQKLLTQTTKYLQTNNADDIPDRKLLINLTNCWIREYLKLVNKTEPEFSKTFTLEAFTDSDISPNLDWECGTPEIGFSPELLDATQFTDKSPRNLTKHIICAKNAIENILKTPVIEVAFESNSVNAPEWEEWISNNKNYFQSLANKLHLEKNIKSNAKKIKSPGL